MLGEEMLVPMLVEVISAAAVISTNVTPVTVLFKLTAPVLDVRLTILAVMVPPLLVTFPAVLVNEKVEPVAFELPATSTPPELVSVIETFPVDVAVNAPAVVADTVVPPVPELSVRV
jgi:hypothetical protein